MMDKTKLASLFDVVNETLAKINVDEIDENHSSSVDPLPLGYYYVELVTTPEFTESKTTHRPMFKCSFKTLNDGVNLENTEVLQDTKDRYEWKYYLVDDERGLKNFISDMMKFKIDSKGTSLPPEAFKSVDLMLQALELLNGKRAFIMISESVNKQGKKDEQGEPLKNRFVNLITFERAESLGLSNK